MGRSRRTASGSRSRSSTSRATTSSALDYVFGYGSLVETLEAEGSVAELRGYRRRWAVAMDNSRDIAGYKFYIDEKTGERPGVFVAFLDLEPDPATTVNGVVFPVTPDELAALDNRERSYSRREVEIGVAGRVWAYFGRPEARKRARNDNVVVHRAYLESVRDGFAQLGSDQFARFRASTDDPAVPIQGLRRIDT